MKPLLSALAALTFALPAAAQMFQPAKLPAASRDTFQVLMQGQPFGTFVITLSQAGGNYTFAGEANLTQMGMVSYDSVTFNATTLAPVAMSSRMSMQGMSANTSVTVSGGKATGTAQQPGPAGIQSVAIDAPIAAGVIGDGSDFVLLPTVALAEGYSGSFQVFDPKSGATKTSEIKVLGKETVTVPAGTFETFKVQLASNETATLYITTAEPRRIVMARIEGPGIEMRRINK
jgi:hypothetical protein